MWMPPKSLEPKFKEIAKQPWPYFKKEEEIQKEIRFAYFRECKDELNHVYETVSKNITWLCKRHKVSRDKMLTDLQNTLGIIINKNAYLEGTKNRLKTLISPLTIAKYFNISLKDLMFSDLSIVDNLLPQGIQIGEL
jgi:hypothetical protein